MPIHLSSLLPISNPKDYKVHLACWNGETQPLDAFVRDRVEWDDWDRWRSGKDEFNRPFVLSLIDFYREPWIWLFGGIYKVLSFPRRFMRTAIRSSGYPTMRSWWAASRSASLGQAGSDP